MLFNRVLKRSSATMGTEYDLILLTVAVMLARLFTSSSHYCGGWKLAPPSSRSSGSFSHGPSHCIPKSHSPSLRRVASKYSAFINLHQQRIDVMFQLGLANGDSGDAPDRLIFQDENDRPMINVRDFEEEKKQEEIARRRRENNNNNNNNLTQRPISSLSSSESKPRSKVFGSLTAEELTKKRDELRPSAANRGKVLSKIEDLNGIDPFTPLVFSVVPAGMAIVGWQTTSFLATHFAIQFVSSDIYPVQRFSVVARNLVVGISALATGFCGVVFLGLLLLGGRVLYGVSTGELDPKQSSSSSSSNNNSNEPSAESSRKSYVQELEKQGKTPSNSISGIVGEWIDKQQQLHQRDSTGSQ